MERPTAEQEVLPGPEQFPAVMARTIELVNERISPRALQEVARVFRLLRWEFTDYGVHVERKLGVGLIGDSKGAGATKTHDRGSK